MDKIRQYDWAVRALAAAVFLFAGVYMLVNFEDATNILIPIIGFSIFIFQLIRLKPLFKGIEDKTYLILLYFELVVNIVIGFIFMFKPDWAVGGFNYFVATIIYIRGVIYFWGVSARVEFADYISFPLHILFVSVGFSMYFWMNVDVKDLLVYLIIIIFLMSGYFGYTTYTGYNNFRIGKSNRLKLTKHVEKKETEEVIVDKKEEVAIIDEPQTEKVIINEEEPLDQDTIS